MKNRSRRKFLSEVGNGMLVGSLGTALAADMGLSTAYGSEETDRLTFGELEPLVSAMQETPLERLQPKLVSMLNSGTDLRTLVAAGALANARTFGGHDYIGYHTFMALTPALDMAAQLPDEMKPLPVLKVLYRNTQRIQAFGGSDREVLRPVARGKTEPSRVDGRSLQAATRQAKFGEADEMMAAINDHPAGEIFNHVQYSVQDSANVHRVVLAWRAWATLDLVGQEHAGTLLRQSVRFCLNSSERRIDKRKPDPELWTLLPKMFDQYKLAGKPLGNRKADDMWIEDFAWTVATSNRAQAADAAAAALAEGFSPDSIAEAISVAANLLLLHDPGRTKQSGYDKDKGSVHGDSVGVHASDAANAWRNIAKVSSPRNTIASIIVGAYHTAGQMGNRRHERWPLKSDEVASITDSAKLIEIAEDAVRQRDQGLAAAAVERYHQLGAAPKPVFGMLLKYATSEEGALHAEKFYRTVTEEFATTRETLRWRQLIGLARVTASEFGTKAGGYHQACELIGIQA